MRYPNSDSEGRDSHLSTDHYRASQLPEDDGVPTLPGIVLRERVKRGVTIAAVIVLIVLACASARALLAWLPSTTTSIVHAAAPTVAAPSATPSSTAGPTIGVASTATATPMSAGSTDTPVPSVTLVPTATDVPQPRPTNTPQPTPIPPTPLRVNLLINPGFEGNGGWTTSAHSFNEQGGHNSAMRHTHWDPTAAYSAFTSQAVNHLSAGTYQASAWIETPCGVAGNGFTIVDVTNNAQLATYTIPACQNNWVQITIQTRVANGNVAIKFTSNTGATDWLRMDDVTFMRLS